MLAKRIIPCLDVRDGKVVKGINFVGIKEVGDPVECAAEYDRQGADEIVFLDITASNEGRGTMLDVVSRTAILAKQLGISEHQLSYITHSNSGEGLLFYGNVTIPFVDRFPRGEIYDLLTTRPEDLAHERTDE